MVIFDPKIRNSQRPIAHGENLYDYYDQSDRPVIAGKRGALNQWASHYPQSEAVELRARMASSTRHFQAAELELALHEIFRRHGFVPTIHPEAPSGNKFDLGLSRSEFSAYVEITTLLSSNEEVAEENRTAPILNALNKLRLPKGHSFLVSIERCGDRSPSLRMITAKAEQWVLLVAPAQAPFPELLIEEAGWKLK